MFLYPVQHITLEKINIWFLPAGVRVKSSLVSQKFQLVFLITSSSVSFIKFYPMSISNTQLVQRNRFRHYNITVAMLSLIQRLKTNNIYDRGSPMEFDRQHKILQLLLGLKARYMDIKDNIEAGMLWCLSL